MVTIEADEEVWRELTMRKDPGDSYNDVLRRVLDLDDSTAAADAERASTPPESPVVSRARDALAEWDPTDVDTTKARRATVAAVAWLAQQEGPQGKAEIVAFLETSEAGSAYAETTLWQKVVRPGLRELVEAELVTHQRNVGYEIVAGEAGED